MTTTLVMGLLIIIFFLLFPVFGKLISIHEDIKKLNVMFDEHILNRSKKKEELKDKLLERAINKIIAENLEE